MKNPQYFLSGIYLFQTRIFYQSLTVFYSQFSKMDQQGFLQKLYEIKPFKIVQSPNSKAKHSRQQLPQPQQRQENLHEESLKNKDDLTQSQMFTNLSLNFDQLFSRIQQIKSQFGTNKVFDTQKPYGDNFQTFDSCNNLKDQKQLEKTQAGTAQDLSSAKMVNLIQDSNKENWQNNIEFEVITKQIPNKKQNILGSLKAFNQEKKTLKHYKSEKIMNFEKKVVGTAQHYAPIEIPYNLEIEQKMQKLPLSLRDFQLGKSLGSGKFGDVFQCKHKATNTFFALKKIFKSTILQYDMVQQFMRQLKILYYLNHPNIIKLYGHFDDQYHIFLLMEYAEGGSLIDHLKQGEQFTSHIMEQMLSAVQYLQKNQIAHRDIKPQNIVLCVDGTVKLCDFGWASSFENNMKTTFCGTLDYVSPQMKDKGQYTLSVDLWSLGVLTFQLICGFAPFKEQINFWKMRGGARSLQWNWDIIYPPDVTLLAQSFMRSILKQNPDDRASIRMCKIHPFIKKYKQESQTQIQVRSQLLMLF